MDNEDLMKVFVSESLNAPKDIAAFVPKTAQDILSEREVDALHSVTKHCEDDHSTSDSMSMKVCCGDSKTEAHVTVDGENECFSVSETLNSTDQFDIEQNALNVLPVGENLAHLPSGTLDVIRQLAQLPGGLQLVSFENGTVAWLVTPQLMSADTSTTADQLELDAIDIPTEASLVIGNNEDQVDPVITELSKSVNDDAKTSSTDLAENADSASEALFQSSSALLRKLLSRPQSIIKHLSTAAGPGEKTFRCTIDGCGRHYTTQHHLKVHQRTHTGDRPFVCDFDSCCKAFSTNYGLKSHRRVHTGEKPYVCSFDGCDKAFKTSGDLQKHTRTHTGVKPFMCPFEDCKRSFTTSNIRKVHIRTHTGERPYVCDVPSCGKTFASATNYKNHIRIHSGEKPYVCTWDGCGRRFTEYSSLYKHHVVHSPHKPYECADCGKTYRQTSTLAMHRRMVHSDGHDMDAAATNLVQAATAFLVASSNGDVHSPPMLSIQMVDDRGSIGEDAEEKLVIDTSDRQHQLLNPSEGLHIDVPLDMVAMTLSSLATDTHANQEAHGRNGSQVCFITAAGLAGVPSTNY